jgi:hypothetical protein
LKQACQICMFIFMTFQHPNLNAHLIQNAPYSLHASKKNVKIHVSQQNVVLMLIAKPVITEHFVFVESDMLEILTISVKNVSYFFPFPNFIYFGPSHRVFDYYILL